MKIKFLAPLILIVLLFAACNGDSHNGYTIDGTIKGFENQELVLEQLSPKRLIQIDTTSTDADGNFTFKGNVKEKGFYRIINGQKFWIILLENTKMTFMADSEDASLRNISLEGYTEGKEFQKTIDFLISKQDEYGVEAKKMQASQYSPEISAQDKAKMQADFEVFQKSIMTAIKDKASENIENNPFSTIYLLSSLNPQEDGNFMKEQLAALKTKLPNSEYVINLDEVLANFEKEKVEKEKVKETAAKSTTGNPASEIIMNNPQGKEMKLSDLKGKIVLLDFWASWCKPCRRENPHVVKVYHQYKNQGFDIFSVSLDKSAAKWEQAIAQDGLVWENHVSDLKFWQNAAAKLYGVNSIPATFLLDREGNIIAQNLRGAALENKIKEVINQ